MAKRGPKSHAERGINNNPCHCGCGGNTGRKSHKYMPGHNPKNQNCLCGCGERTTRGNQKWLPGHRDGTNIGYGSISADRALEIALRALEKENKK